MSAPIMVLGRQGQLASEIAKAAARLQMEVAFAGRDTLDLMANLDAGAVLDRISPCALINAAAYSAVDAAESDEAAAMRVNAEVPGLFAAACATRGLPFVHVSTDYVFDGEKGAPYVEADPTAPLNVYGRSKAEGEAAVMRAGGDWTILRTAWLFSACGSNFAKTMLRLAQSRDEIGVVEDQLGTPTFAGDLAEAALVAAKRARDTGAGLGLLHLAGAQHASWADLAEGVLDAARARGLRSAQVRRITTQDYPTPSRRPKDTRLDTSRAEAVMGWRARPWRAGVERMLDDLGPAAN